MSHSITIRRWRLELSQRAIHLVRQPDPNCPDCAGDGGYQVSEHGIADYDLCHCWSPNGYRIPLAPRRRNTDYGMPF